MSLRERDDDILDIEPTYITITYALAVIIVFSIYAVLWIIANDSMIISVDQIWRSDSDLSSAVGKVWFIFAWGAGLSVIAGMVAIVRGYGREFEPYEIFFKGAWISINAGFFEEIIFRWLTFFSAMVMIRFFNWMTFGLFEWFYTEIAVPVANWATFGALEAQLINHPNWILGAAIISANAEFRNAHNYLGFFGYVNSWFLGMVFFWVMFNYGIFAAIIIHILYDFAIFSTHAFMSLFQRRRLFGMRY